MSADAPSEHYAYFCRRSGFESRRVIKSRPALIGKDQASLLHRVGAANAQKAMVVGMKSRTGVERLRIETEYRDRSG